MQWPARKRETGRLGPERGVRDGTHGVTERCQSVIVRGQDSFCIRPCPAQVTLTESDIVVRYRSVLITPCSSPPVTIRQKRASPGWGASGCNSYSGSLNLSPRNEHGVKSKTNAQRIQA